MTTTINASTSAGLVQTADTSGALALQTAGTTALTINSSQVVNFANAPTVASAPFTASQWTTSGANIYYNTGNVGVGTATPAYKLETTGSIFANGIEVGANTDSIKRAGDLYLITTGANNLIFRTNNTEGMRLNSSRQFIVNGTTTSAIQSGTAGFYASGSNDCGFGTNGTGALGAVAFYNPNGGVGSIQTSGSSTIYNTGSDYRLKENIQPMTNALAKVAQLKPCTYKWKFDGTDGEGFIAHELAEVFPIAVSGQKDEMQTYTDDDGNEQTRPKWQGVDASFLVATLTAAIQELKALNDTQAETITALTARIVALEGQ